MLENDVKYTKLVFKYSWMQFMIHRWITKFEPELLYCSKNRYNHTKSLLHHGTL